MSLLSFTKKITGRAETAAEPTTTKSKKATGTKRAAKQAGILPAVVAAVDLMPLVSEKSVAAETATSTVVFRVRPTVSKGQIAAAVKARYEVTPLKVRTLQQGPKRRRRGRTEGYTSSWKKAYVTLPKGTSIDFAS